MVDLQAPMEAQTMYDLGQRGGTVNDSPRCALIDREPFSRKFGLGWAQCPFKVYRVR